MRVLVTGGLGFIGAYVRDELLNAGMNVRIFDIQNSQGSVNDGADVVHGDVFDLKELNRAFHGVDFVIHLIGVRDAHRAEEDPDLSFRLNVLALHNVLEACRVCGVKRLLFPSSAAVYGRTEKIPVSEEDPGRPTGIYAYHKWLGEELIRAYRATYGMPYTIFRLFNAVGKGNQNIIDHCVRAAIKGEPITIFGGDQLRDFVSIHDVARAFRLSIIATALDNRTINVGSGKGRTIRQLAQLVQGVFPQLEVRFEERPNFVPYHSVADVTLARTLLGFSAESSDDLLEDVIRKVAEDE